MNYYYYNRVNVLVNTRFCNIIVVYALFLNVGSDVRAKKTLNELLAYES